MSDFFSEIWRNLMCSTAVFDCIIMRHAAAGPLLAATSNLITSYGWKSLNRSEHKSLNHSGHKSLNRSEQNLTNMFAAKL